jgi:hypothetical protein
MRFWDAIILATTVTHTAVAFSTPRSLRSSRFVPSNAKLFRTRRTASVVDEIEPEDLVPISKDAMITPEGFGFTAPARRIVKEANRPGSGYYRASSSENIMSVVTKITGGSGSDVALVFDDQTNKIVGLFTETDYIKVSISEQLMLVVVVERVCA